MYKIYLADVKNIDGDTYNLFYSSLPSEERAKIDSLKNRNKQLEKLLGYMLVRYAIKDFFGIPMKNQGFSYTINGKPSIIGYDKVYFNLSHSNGMAACTVSDSEIGVDIEKIRPIGDKLINTVCNDDEKKHIDESDNKSSEFIKIWTAKEALTKRIGEGLRGNLKLISSDNAKSFLYKNEYWISVSP